MVQQTPTNRIANEFAGMADFVWFFGVVEDRADPLNVGRVRVRCFGWHSPSREEVPTDTLPWAQTMTPIHNAAMTGIGYSATGLIEGTLVFGFFADGRNAQQPMVLGSFPGIPQLGAGRGEAGFSDPNALYPIPSQVGFPDTPKLAYNRWTEDKISQDKTANRVTNIPTASGPALSKVSRTEAIAAGSWEEPVQRGTANSAFPFNHVFQSESGHAREWDDTPGCERIHEYHKSGTFYEVQPDGSRITKIVGKDYEIIADDKNVLITGACNITINGDSRILVKGNKIEEINGDYHLTVHGSMLRKMDGNDLLEVNSARSETIAKTSSSFINENQITSVGKDRTTTIRGNDTETIVKKKHTTVSDDVYLMISGNLIAAVTESAHIGASDTLNIAAGTMIYATNMHVKGTSTADVDHISNGISGHDHRHTDTPGLGAGVTSPPHA